MFRDGSSHGDDLEFEFAIALINARLGSRREEDMIVVKRRERRRERMGMSANGDGPVVRGESVDGGDGDGDDGKSDICVSLSLVERDAYLASMTWACPFLECELALLAAAAAVVVVVVAVAAAVVV